MLSGDNKIVRRQTRGQQYLEEMSQDVGNIFRDFRNKLLESSRENAPITDGGNLGGITVTGDKSAKKKPFWLSPTGAGNMTFTGNSVAIPILNVLGHVADATNKAISNYATSNTTPTGVYSVQSPQQVQANQQVRQEIENTLNEKVWPVTMPTNYLTALFTEGSLNPYRGAEIKSHWSPVMQLGAASVDMWGAKKVGQGVGKVTEIPRFVVDKAAEAGFQPAKAAVVAREMQDINPKAVGEVADVYTMDKSITGPIVQSDGKNRYIYKKNRFRKETGNGLLNVKFKPFSPENNHRLALDPTELVDVELPSNAYYMNLSILPYKRSFGRIFGNKIDTSLYPNLQYNAYRYLHWAEPKIQELGMQYLSTGDLGPIVQYYKTASPLEKQQLSAIARQPAFLNSETPYRYYTDNNLVMQENSSVQRMVNKLSKNDLREYNSSLGWATTNDLGYPVILNKKSGFQGNMVVSHEGNHAYQYRFPQPLNMQSLIERALPAAQTKLVKGKKVRITGNDKTGVGSAHLNAERGSTLHETRSLLIRKYYQQNGRFPTFQELNSMIDKMDNTSLTKAIESSNGYGQEYAPLITDFAALKEALKYGYKKGGKIW